VGCPEASARSRCGLPKRKVGEAVSLPGYPLQQPFLQASSVMPSVHAGWASMQMLEHAPRDAGPEANGQAQAAEAGGPDPSVPEEMRYKVFSDLYARG
jgi:hypothetical protein